MGRVLRYDKIVSACVKCLACRVLGIARESLAVPFPAGLELIPAPQLMNFLGTQYDDRQSAGSSILRVCATITNDDCPLTAALSDDKVLGRASDMMAVITEAPLLFPTWAEMHE